MRVFLFLLTLSVCVFQFGCTDSSNTKELQYSNAGSISAQVVWPGEVRDANITQAVPMALTGDVCIDFGVTYIVAKVYDMADELTAQSDYWDCSDRKGLITDVKPGQVYVVIEGFVGNIDDSPEWLGRSVPIQVVSGQTNTELSDNPIEMANQSDLISPSVVAVIPDPGDVALGASISIEFSEPMLDATIDTASVSIVETVSASPLACDLSYDSLTYTVTLTPQTGFAEATDHRLTITIDVVDLAGNALPEELTWDFVTNAPPISANATVSVDEDTTLSFTPTVNDPHENQPHTFNIETNPAHGTVTVIDNQLVYTPEVNFNGTDSFDFRAADDSGASVVGTALVTVTPVNDPPVADAGGNAAFHAGETVMLSGSGEDIEGDRLSYAWTQVGGPPAILNDANAAQPLFLVPDISDASANLTFELVLNDGTDNSAPDTVTIVAYPYTGSSHPGFSGNPFLSRFTEAPRAIKVAVSGDYAYVADILNDLMVVDVSDPTKPILLGSVYTSCGIGDITIVGNYAYMATQYGVCILDISTPSAPVTVGSCNTSSSSPGNIVVSGNYAYVTDFDAGFTIVNISDPASPSLAVTVPVMGTHTKGIDVSGDYAYVASYVPSLYPQGYLQIFDVSDPTAPVETGSIYRPLPVDEVAVHGDFAYVVEFYSDSAYSIYDISDKTNPTRIAGETNLGDDGIVDSMVINNGRLYLTSFFIGLQIIDISDPDPTVQNHIGGYSTFGSSMGLAVSGNYAYVADDHNGLMIYNIANPSRFSFTGQFDNLTTKYQQLASKDGLAFLTNEQGLQIVNTERSSSPELVGEYAGSINYDGESVRIDKNLAFVGKSSSRSNFDIFDISDPSAPNRLSSYGSSNYSPIWDIDIKDQFAFLACDVDGLEIVNISDPSNPQLIGSYDTPGTAMGIDVAGDFAYLGDDTSGLAIVDIKEPSDPLPSGTQYTGGRYRSLVVAGDFAYNAVWGGDAVIVDISNPENPLETGTIERPAAWRRQIDKGGGYVVMAEERHGWFVYDVENPAEPKLAGHFSGLSIASGAVFDGPDILLVDEKYGLQIGLREPRLDNRYVNGVPGATRTYQVQWDDPIDRQDMEVACYVTGGSCRVTHIFQNYNYANVYWNLSGSSGDIEITFIIGNQNFFISTKDRISVE